MQYKNNINLEDLPDIVLVNNIKKNNDFCEDSLITLSNRHSGLYISTVSRISGSALSTLKEDLLEEIMLVLYNSANSFDENKGSKFSTHFANETKWNCLKNKTKKSNREIPCEIDIIESFMPHEENILSIQDEKDNFSSILNSVIEEIEDERAVKIFKLRYFSQEKKNLPWKKISKQVGLSIQGCINIHNKYIKVIKEKLNKRKKYEH